MIDKNDALYKDFETVKQIPIISTMLEVICRTTGLGFSAVARVTDNRWLACSVRDEVAFGLAEGNELKIETTICNEIRDHHQPVVIDHVDKDDKYRGHHTPKMYGLQSYISYPIFLKNGEFFGTLCAIGSEPALLDNAKVRGTFLLFTELLSFHMESIHLMERSKSALEHTSGQLINSQTENRLYQKISDHNLQEPLRKIALFSDMLINNIKPQDTEQAKQTAVKINSLSQELIGMVQQITKFSALDGDNAAFEWVDLNKTLDVVCTELATDLTEKNSTVNRGTLPKLPAVAEHMHRLFFQLINHAVTFSKADGSAIRIYLKTNAAKNNQDALLSEKRVEFCEICIEQTGVDTERHNLADIFDIFLHADNKDVNAHYDTGLAECRKIAYNHGGTIHAAPVKDSGICFSVILPIDETKIARVAEELSVDA